MHLLRINRFVAYRQQVPLFASVSFDMEPGDLLCITGENGVGKTTLLECIAGLYHNWQGDVVIPEGLVSYFQQNSDYVRTLPLSRLARLVDGFDAKKYCDLLSNLDLAHKENRLLALLSGGELQRARILLALLRRHKVLLLDEPFANVDKSSCSAIAAELERTRSQRATIIVTHPRDAHDISIKGIKRYDLNGSRY